MQSSWITTPIYRDRAVVLETQPAPEDLITFVDPKTRQEIIMPPGPCYAADAEEVGSPIPGRVLGSSYFKCSRFDCNNMYMPGANAARVLPNVTEPHGSESFTIAMNGRRISGAVHCNMCGMDFWREGLSGSDDDPDRERFEQELRAAAV